MNTSNLVHEEMVDLIFSKVSTAKLYQHAVCKTSEESRQARLEASGESVTGAKALLIKIDAKEEPYPFAVIILPGFNKLDSKALKQELKDRLPSTRNFRFATAEEMSNIARGMEPGRMPPFGKPIFPEITYTFVDKALLDHERIGFNAADFGQSIIMQTKDLLEIMKPDAIFPCSFVSAA